MPHKRSLIVRGARSSASLRCLRKRLTQYVSDRRDIEIGVPSRTDITSSRSIWIYAQHVNCARADTATRRTLPPDKALLRIRVSIMEEAVPYYQ